MTGEDRSLLGCKSEGRLTHRLQPLVNCCDKCVSGVLKFHQIQLRRQQRFTDLNSNPLLARHIQGP